MTQTTSCCGKSGSANSCVCASQAKCSCGKKTALHCDCARSATENVVQGARCSCRKRLDFFPAYNSRARIPWCDKLICWHISKKNKERDLQVPVLASEQRQRTKPWMARHAAVARGLPVSLSVFFLARFWKRNFHPWTKKPNVSIKKWNSFDASCIDACSCEKASDGGVLPSEIDFPPKKAWCLANWGRLSQVGALDAR